jgi:hypothetical protein
MGIFSRNVFWNRFLSLFVFGGLLFSLQACGSELATPVTVASPTANPSPTLTAVTSPTPEPTSPIANKNSWQYNWLKKIACAAPCWEGITPGITSFAEAREILSKKPFVSLRSPGLTPTIEWDWVGGKNRPTGMATCNPCTRSAPVLNYLGMSFEVSYKLQDIIDAYGEPTHIETILYPIDKQWNYSTSILFLNHGFKIGFQTYTKPIFSPDLTEEFGVGFFPITDENTYNTQAIKVGEEPRTSVWEGYKSYDFYCRDLKGQDYCKQVKSP